MLLLRRQIGSNCTSTYSVDGIRVTAEEYRRVLNDRLSLGPHTQAASLLLQVRIPNYGWRCCCSRCCLPECCTRCFPCAF